MKALLILNAGSSSLKFALFSIEPSLADRPGIQGQVEGIGTAPRMLARDEEGQAYDEAVAAPPDVDQNAHHRAALTHLFDWLGRHNGHLSIVAAGHRVVHGGEYFSAPTQLDAGSLATLDTLIPLAPLHQPHNLRAIRTLAELMPGIPQVACFDTAFHRSQPAVAQAFALPRALSAEGVKRYGFHGLSYEYIARQLPDVLGEETARGGVVIAHLGNGASMCALREGRSQASTMGFTALDGLVMGTRTGNLDPGVLLYLMEQKGMDAKALTRLLYKESGLLGVSGLSQDMRDLLASNAAEAREAVELFCYRIARELGSLAAAAGGLDALVFTGGIGEHADPVRARVAHLSRWLGVEIQETANRAHARRIEAPGSRVKVAVVATNEEWMIAHHTARLIAS
ncbi:MAG: acetate/propionate family kinase [Rhodocyclaceae bacterium]|jgi:acetate kinase|nr:acetate/propionate family kinase [Rhodocyclaceae bacterium]